MCGLLLCCSRPSLAPLTLSPAQVNCNKSNKELGVALKIRVAPTFHLYKNSEKVAEMTGRQGGCGG